VAAGPAATRRNQSWSMDFVSDCVSTGKVMRMLTIVDDCARECLAIEKGLPKAIVVDRGPEFRGRALPAFE
jgi:putative transposase